MDKTENVTKDSRRVEAARKGREKYMDKLKESIPNDVKKGIRDTTNASNETTSVTNTTTARSNYTYVYSVGIFAVLAIGVCVFFAYNTFQPKIKKLTNDHSTARHEQKKDQLPKRHPML